MAKIAKKRILNKATYKKGTTLSDLSEIRKVLEKSSVVYIKDQTIYDDESESITIEIHFK